MTESDPIDILKNFGGQADESIPLFEAALQFSRLARPGLEASRYRHHINKLTEEIQGRVKDLIAAGAMDNAETQIAALKHIFHDAEAYDGDRDHYDHFDNADITRTIDRRKGLPITLAILVIEAARRAGFEIHGINFPGHFLVRLDHGTQRLIFDPFSGFRILTAADLRQLVKSILGPQAELSSQYYEPASSREILLRLQNNIKTRLIEAEEYEHAARIIEQMKWIAPKEQRLLFDAGIVYARMGHTRRAIQELETYLKFPHEARDRREVEDFLQNLRESLN